MGIHQQLITLNVVWLDLWPVKSLADILRVLTQLLKNNWDRRKTILHGQLHIHLVNIYSFADIASEEGNVIQLDIKKSESTKPN